METSPVLGPAKFARGTRVMKNMPIFITLSCSLVWIAGTYPVWGQHEDPNLEEQRITIKMEKIPLGIVLDYLRETCDIPIGFEQSNLDRGQRDYRFSANSPGVSPRRLDIIDGVIKVSRQHGFEEPLKPITIVAENERLGAILDKIVKQVENYRWEVNDGVVNFIPTKGRDDRFEKLLNLRIKRFTLEKDKTVLDITATIKSLPEFSAFLHNYNLRFTGQRSGPTGALEEQYGRRISTGMDFSHVTFRDLLNKIVKVKQGAWILRWKSIPKLPDEKEEIDIDI